MNPQILLLAALSFAASSSVMADDFVDCVVPICEMDATLDEFRSLRESRRFAYLEQLTLDYGTNVDVASALNLVEFAQSVKAILAEGAETSERVKEQSARLLEQSYAQLALYSNPADAPLLDFFKALTTQTNRYNVLANWGTQLDKLTDVAALRNLEAFFGAAEQICTAAGDEEYVARDAARFKIAATDRLIQVAPAPAFQLPITDMNKAVADFRGLPKADRYLLLQKLAADYAVSLDTTVLASLETFAQLTLAVAQEDSQADVANQASALRSQVLVSLLQNPALTLEQMVGYFAKVETQATRFAVVQFWGTQIETLTDAKLLRKLVHFFAQAGSISEKSGDEEYAFREAYRQEQLGNQRLIALLPAPAFPMPVTDMAARVAAYRSYEIPERFLLVKKLADDYAASTDTRALVSVVDFARQAKAISTEAGANEAFIVEQADLLLDQSYPILVKSPDLSADELVSYYRELPGQGNRYAALQFWGEKIDAAPNKAAASRLVRFFGLARRASLLLEDEDFVTREAQRNETRAKAKLASLPN